jgi:DNA segregation ATPase FtsK/SpoIIIE, S-DNA-T family
VADKGYVDRPPRIQPVLPMGEVEIPPAPKFKERSSMALRQSMLPLITVVGYVLVSIFGQGRNLLMIVPMGLSVVITSIFAFQTYRDEVRKQEEEEKEYQLLLAELRKDMINDQDQQRNFYYHNYPEADRILRIDGSNIDSRSGSRLWERRSTDDDFGALRIGISSRPSTIIYKIAQGGAGGNDDEQPQHRDARKLAADSEVVFEVPVLLSLYGKPEERQADKEEGADEKVAHAAEEQHAVGIVGAPDDLYPFVRALAANYVAFHAPTDANVLVVGRHGASSQWEWVDKLPHCPVPKSKDQRSYYPICFEPETGKDPDKERDKVSLFWRALRFELDQRNMRRADKNVGNVRLPFLLVIVDMMDAPGASWLENSSLKDLESEAAVSTIMNTGKELGVAVLFLVPERRKVPSGCGAVIEVSKHEADPSILDFRYAEVGVNTPRYVGRADVIPDQRVLSKFAQNLAEWKVRRSYGQDIPSSVGLFELFRTDSLDGLTIADNWERSTKPDNSEWMEGALGIMSGGAVRRLVYSADRDGVHGMVAGSTGSGKSELLMTLILGLAIRYDPSIINFVLIDYKGGAAFVPFANLPHCVDIVTNLQGSAVDRMFAAINAELNRRQEINTRENVKHIVHYRQKGYHLDEARAPYPHLFVIIDEFAEMMAGKAEYKAQLNSITRLGRALGVTLILAAQRPTGVTDQMRANIKFRISLRVETREESNEMLRRPDAAYLPPGVPGRGYLQIGNENIELIQVAYSGAEYIGYDLGKDEAIDLKRYADRDVIWVDRLSEPKEPPKLFEVLVAEMDRLSKLHSSPQKKPWPSPLPNYIGLGDPIPEIEYLHPEDIDYLTTHPDHTDEDEPLRINAAMQNWLNGSRTTWSGVDWRNRAMRAVVGLIDDPGNAQQRALTLNLRRGHGALFGASGWGKTTFLRTVVMSLATIHSPEELHVYILDFGGRALEVLRELPHVGAIVTPDEEERVDRLLRFLDDQLEFRKQFLSQAQASSVFSYNAQNPDKPLPSILVLIDNFAELRENFESRLSVLTSLVREGLSNGVHFMVTGEQSNAIPNRMFSLFTERYALKLADTSDYTTIIGRSIPGIEDIAGRGFLAIDRVPLEFQTSIPVPLSAEERALGRDETKALAGLIEHMRDKWADGWRDPSLRPQEILTLPTLVTLESVLEAKTQPKERPVAIIGLNDSDLMPTLIDLSQQPHFLISGQQLSGKTATLRSWVLSLAHTYTPDQAAFILMDPLGFLPNYMSGQHTMASLPHVLDVVSERDDLERVMAHLDYEYNVLPSEQMNKHEIFVLIDNYDDFKDLKPDLPAMAAFTRVRPGRPAVHFIVCGTPIGMRTSDDFLKRVAMTRNAVALDSASVQAAPLNATIPRSLREGELPLGRGFLVKAGKTYMLQLATPYNADEPLEVSMDRWIEGIIKKHKGKKAEWKPLPDDDEAGEGEPAAEAAASGNGAAKPKAAKADGKGSKAKPSIAPSAAAAKRDSVPEGQSAESINELRDKLVEMYKSMNLPVEMVANLPPAGILEMAEMNGLLKKPEPTPEG